MRHFAIVLLALLAFASPSMQAASASDEYLIVSGGVSLHQWEKWKAAPHDNWWMNFVRASRIRIQELRAQQGPAANITWLVYKSAYVTRSKQEGGNDLIGNIESVRDAYGVKLVFFDRTAQLIDYINNGQPRDQVKISGLEYFGHSNKACLMFDYSNNIDSASKVWLHENELKQIRRGIFARDAFVKSWGCHTGESMAKKFRSATGVPMWGAIGKTQYRTEELPFLSTAGGRWVR